MGESHTGWEVDGNELSSCGDPEVTGKLYLVTMEEILFKMLAPGLHGGPG